MQPVNNIILQLEKHKNKYTDIELRILQFIGEHPLYVIENSIVNIAKQCQVSEATITRFSRKAGFKGFNELKQLLSQEHFRVEFKEKKSTTNTLLDKLAIDYKEVLDKTVGLTNVSDIDTFIKMINKAKRIKVYGISSSGLVATEISYKLARIGYDIRAITDSHEMRRDASVSGKDDLIIGISLSGATLDVVTALKIGKTNGAKTVAFTNYPDSKLAEKAGLVFIIPQKDLMETGQFINAQIPIFFLVDYIYAEIVSKDLEKYLAIKAKAIQAIVKKEGK